MRLLSVTELSAYLRDLIATDPILDDLWVEGEVSNLSRASSGHVYLTLKQASVQISAVCWRSSVVRMGELPKNGEVVLAHGRVGYYESRGQAQLVVDLFRPAGIGQVQAQLDELRLRLEAEGLFSQDRKRALPALPRRVAVVTSPGAAALQDILHVLARRCPLLEVLIAPCLVQGDQAAESIVEALVTAAATGADVIILARGGGSSEDLWCFNDERVVRAVFASPVPVITGVGHETDTTLVDYVADLRAPTPSAAAEQVAPDVTELSLAVAGLQVRLDEAMRRWLDERHEACDRQVRALRVHVPTARIASSRQQVDDLQRRAQRQVIHGVHLRRARAQGLLAQLAALNPQAVLQRGFAVVQRMDGMLVTQPGDAPTGTRVQITVRGGVVPATTE